MGNESHFDDQAREWVENAEIDDSSLSSCPFSPPPSSPLPPRCVVFADFSLLSGFLKTVCEAIGDPYEPLLVTRGMVKGKDTDNLLKRLVLVCLYFSSNSFLLPLSLF